MTTTAAAAWAAKSGASTSRPQSDDEGVYDHMRCRAGACRLRGTVSVGSTTGPFFCGFHAWVDARHWEAVSTALVDHDWMLRHMGELHEMLRVGKRGEAIAVAREFWAEQPDMLPNDNEARHLEHYLYRLNLDLQFRVGARSEKPAPFRPQAEARKTARSHIPADDQVTA